MASDDLSQTLLGLSAWWTVVQSGAAEMTPEGAEAFELALQKAAMDAIALEDRLADRLALDPAAAPLHDAAQGNNVLVIPTRAGLAVVHRDLPFTDGR